MLNDFLESLQKNESLQKFTQKTNINTTLNNFLEKSNSWYVEVLRKQDISSEVDTFLNENYEILKNLLGEDQISFIKNIKLYNKLDPNFKYIILTIIKNKSFVKKLLSKVDKNISYNNILKILLENKVLDFFHKQKINLINKEKIIALGFILGQISESDFDSFFNNNNQNSELEKINIIKNFLDSSRDKKNKIKLTITNLKKLNLHCNREDLLPIIFYITSEDSKYVNPQQQIIAVELLKKLKENNEFKELVDYLNSFDFFVISDYIPNENFLDKAINFIFNSYFLYSVLIEDIRFNFSLENFLNLDFAIEILSKLLNSENDYKKVIEYEGVNLFEENGVYLRNLSECNNKEIIAGIIESILESSLSGNARKVDFRQVPFSLISTFLTFNDLNKYGIFNVKTNKMVGVINLYQMENDFLNDDYHIGIFTLKEHRGKKYMSKAILLLIDDLKKNNKNIKLVAWVNVQNHPVHSLFEKLGFTLEKKNVLYYGAMQNKYVYEIVSK